MSERDAFLEALHGRLDAIAKEGRWLDFWWRDDDAVEPTPALDGLLTTAEGHGVPIAIAAIPRSTGAALAERLAQERPDIVVLQHGFAHRNHAPPGEKAAELGAHRPIDDMLAELAAGRRRLQALFGERFLPVLVPPWNRLSEEVARRRGEAGLAGLSTFARMHADDAACLNTHVDVIDWKGGRRFAGYAKMLRVFCEEIERRVASDRTQIGLLTHHLVHDSASRDFLDGFLSVAAGHPAVRWPRTAALFGVSRPAAGGAAANARPLPGS